jgi:hypothetical protein
MPDDADNSGLGLIVGVLLAAVVVFLAIGFGPSLFQGTSRAPDVNVTVTAPPPPAEKK